MLYLMHDLSCAACREHLQRFADCYDEYRDWRTQVLAITQEPDDQQGIIKRLHLPFPVLFDPDNAAHSLYLDNAEVGIVVLDRWNGLQLRQGASEITQLMSPAEALEWVAASEIVCPECGVSECLRLNAPWRG